MACNSIHSNNFSISRPSGNTSYLLLYVKTPAVFELNGTVTHTEPNQLIIMDIGFPYKYSANKSYYINDWMYFENISSGFFSSIGLPLNTLIQVQDTDFVTDIFKKILYEFNSDGINRMQTMSFLLHALFMKASEFYNNMLNNYTFSPYSQRLIQLRNDIYANPAYKWTIDEMASQLNICPTYLQRLYKEQFDTTLIEDVIESRLSYSTNFLTHDSISISEIAKLCGYNNDVHFMRQFKKRYNMTPTAYRNLNQG